MAFDFRLSSQKKLEDDYVCSLREDETIYKFANTILFKCIQLSKKANFPYNEIVNILRYHLFNPSKFKSTRKYYQKFNISNKNKKQKFTLRKNAVVKNGYDCYSFNCYNIIKFKTEKELYDFNKTNKVPLLKITSALYKFQSTNKLITYCVKQSPLLTQRVLTFMNEYFGTPKSFTFSDLDKLTKSSKGSWFILWLIYNGSYDIHNIYHHNLINEGTFIRSSRYTFKKESEVHRKDIDDLTCVKSQYDKALDKIVLGTTYKYPVENGIFSNLFKKYKKNTIAGPSGSACMAYMFIFDISRILKDTYENKVLLLKMIIADYYEIHHSIGEILLEYYVDAKFPPYDLSMNDIEYINKL